MLGLLRQQRFSAAFGDAGTRGIITLAGVATKVFGKPELAVHSAIFGLGTNMAHAMQAIMNAGESDEDDCTRYDEGRRDATLFPTIHATANLRQLPPTSTRFYQPDSAQRHRQYNQATWNSVAPAHTQPSYNGAPAYQYPDQFRVIERIPQARTADTSARQEQKHDPGGVIGQGPFHQYLGSRTSQQSLYPSSESFVTPSKRPPRAQQTVAQHRMQGRSPCEHGFTAEHAPELSPTPETPDNMFRIKGAHKPELWDFIRLVRREEYAGVPKDSLVSDNARAAHCLQCGVEIQYTKGTTVYVKKHMIKRHSNHLDAVRKRDHKRRSGVSLSSECRCSTIPASGYSEAKAITPQQQAHANELLGIWIAQSLRPFSIVEDAGLVAYLQYVCEVLGGVKVELPSRVLLRAMIVEVADQLRATLKMIIGRECIYYCITTDIWTSRNTDSYMALTLHYVSEDFQFRSWTLEVEAFPGRHTGEAIAADLSRLFDRWGSILDTVLRYFKMEHQMLSWRVKFSKSTTCRAWHIHSTLSSRGIN